MVKNEILIGRDVGKGEYLIDKQYVKVGRNHARIIRKTDGVYIEDLDSANGTFVNGTPISLKKINTDDQIMLGGVDYYELNVHKVIKLLPLTDEEYQSRFLQLKAVYETFQTESNRLSTKGAEDMMMKRFLPTMLTGTFTGIITLLVGDNLAERLTIAIIGGILSVLVFLVANKLASKSAHTMREKIAQLNKDFEMDYVCPECGMSFKGKSWEFLKRDGKCPACKREFGLN